MRKTIALIYTSDTHGRLSAFDFVREKNGLFGLSRLSTYLKTMKTPYLLLDNGDYLQGSPLLDVTRKAGVHSPVAKVFNAIGVRYATVGNHDFNYGMHVLKGFKDAFRGDILCANIMKDGKPWFKPYDIVDVDGIRLALIGLTTEYIPVWERKEHIGGCEFRDAVQVTQELIKTEQLKERSDVIIVMYHGGYEQNVITHEIYGKKTKENQGYALFQIPEVDLLLTGHQHVPQIYQKDLKWTLQTSCNAMDAGVIELSFDVEESRKTLKHMETRLIRLGDHDPDETIEDLLKDDVMMTRTYLKEHVGSIGIDMTIHSPLSARIRKHPLFQLINTVQMAYTGAFISCASLPNETHGLPHDVTLKDIFTSFPFENDLVVLEVTGKQLMDALEQNASYFSLIDNRIGINPRFLHPKVEHYNYDVYDGIEYVIDVSKPIGSRIKNVTIQGNPIEFSRSYRLALNSYRATGSGGFDMFKDARILNQYPVSYVELISDYIKKHPGLVVMLHENFQVIAE